MFWHFRNFMCRNFIWFYYLNELGNNKNCFFLLVIREVTSYIHIELHPL